MWWMFPQLPPKPEPIDTFPPHAQPAVMAARAMNEMVQTAADAWLKMATTPVGAQPTRSAPQALRSAPVLSPLTLPTPASFGAGFGAPMFGPQMLGAMMQNAFMSFETRDGQTSVSVGQKFPANPFLTLPRMDVSLGRR